MKSDASQLRAFLSSLEGRRRFVEVDASTQDSRSFVDGHCEKAPSCLLHAERMDAPGPAAVVPLSYQVVLSATLLALRREGIAVELHRGHVDADTIWAGALLLRVESLYPQVGRATAARLRPRLRCRAIADRQRSLFGPEVGAVRTSKTCGLATPREGSKRPETDTKAPGLPGRASAVPRQASGIEGYRWLRARSS